MTEEERRIVEAAREFWDEPVPDLLLIVDRLDNKSTAMQALLERWAEKFKNLPDVNYGMWLRDSAKAKDHHKLFSLLTDTKTLLKEAKVE